jgi:hypothetical protein
VGVGRGSAAGAVLGEFEVAFRGGADRRVVLFRVDPRALVRGE